ncbi:MAG: hypothetical protein KGL46_14180 [Hyphomicrobiales bacterium]|nr:hypothetical protein [Hyphomicrobiales bacterium]
MRQGYLLERIIIFVIVITDVIFPNSLKVVGIPALGLLCVYYLLQGGAECFKNYYFYFLSAGIVITLIYILIGQENGATDVGAQEAFVIYVIFPICWGIVFTRIVVRFDLSKIVFVILACVPVIAATVFYFFYMFTHYGPQSVRFFISVPNVEITSEGYVAATMHVFGSLVFIIGAFFTQPKVVDKPVFRMFYIVILIVLAFTAGRSALIFSIVIGTAINIGVGLGRHYRNHTLGVGFTTILVSTVATIVFAGLVALVAKENFNIDFSIAAENAIGKIIPGYEGGKYQEGGQSRYDQLEAFRVSIVKNYFAGVGHGVPNFWYSDPEKPWRYELIWVATVFRTGIVGFLIYAAPFLFAAFYAFRELISGRLDRYEEFLFGGFVAVLLASNTNPYIEGVDLQWMYIFPLVYFLKRYEFQSRAAKSGGNVIA